MSIGAAVDADSDFEVDFFSDGADCTVLGLLKDCGAEEVSLLEDLAGVAEGVLAWTGVDNSLPGNFWLVLSWGAEEVSLVEELIGLAEGGFVWTGVNNCLTGSLWLVDELGSEGWLARGFRLPIVSWTVVLVVFCSSPRLFATDRPEHKQTIR